MCSDWREQHGAVLRNFVLFLNSRSKSFILKGGTSLMLCYGLTRFSEDIDLDALNTSRGLVSEVDTFCKLNNFSYRTVKDTKTVKRYMIHYGGIKPLKVEISYRRRSIAVSEYTVINGILVYTIPSILVLKLNAYNGRDKLRDLYDVVFICKNYWGMLPQTLKLQVADALSYKGLEHFDYITKTQSDDLIDKSVLANEFLELYNALGLL